MRPPASPVAVMAPAGDDPTHKRAVAQRLAELTGAESPVTGFPETPRPDFALVRESFQATLLDLLGGLRERRGGLTSGGGGGRTG